MEVAFKNKKDEDLYRSKRLLVRLYGERMALKIIQRIGELQAALTPQDLPSNARFHVHRGRRQGLYSVDLIHPYRLIVRPLGEYSSWVEIAVVEIYEVLDPH